MREHVNYGDRTSAAGRFTGFNPDEPDAGFYKTRLRSGGVFVGVRIWHGAPLDPVTGEELDRSPRWQAQVNGTYVELDTVWPKCAAGRIDAQEYAYLSSLQAWAAQHAPDSGVANPMRRLDPMTTPVLF